MSKQSITWDEEAIAEHDKERGTRQKIDEPPTPYVHGYDGQEEEEEQMATGAEQISLTFNPSAQQQDIAQNWSALDASLQYELEQRGNTGAADFYVNPTINADIASDRDSETFPEGIFSPHLMRRYPNAAAPPAGTTFAATELNGYETTAPAMHPAFGSPNRNHVGSSPTASEDFKQKRDSHYNEYKVMKAMLARKMAEEEDEDEEC